MAILCFNPFLIRASIATEENTTPDHLTALCEFQSLLNQGINRDTDEKTGEISTVVVWNSFQSLLNQGINRDYSPVTTSGYRYSISSKFQSLLNQGINRDVEVPAGQGY